MNNDMQPAHVLNPYVINTYAHANYVQHKIVCGKQLRVEEPISATAGALLAAHATVYGAHHVGRWWDQHAHQHAVKWWDQHAHQHAVKWWNDASKWVHNTVHSNNGNNGNNYDNAQHPTKPNRSRYTRLPPQYIPEVRRSRSQSSQ